MDNAKARKRERKEEKVKEEVKARARVVETTAAKESRWSITTTISLDTIYATAL